ncbi:MAG: metal dependent phosphohydrolase [Paenibacillus sp.]|nr:metal dependent phosphohydrolase [Paenibacillus sp.]
MERNVVLRRAAEFAGSVHEGDATGHDWPHIERVVRMTRKLCASERADPFVCELAALLHDVADEKLNPSKEAGMAKVEQWLRGEPVEPSVQSHVLDIISTMSYGAGPTSPMRTLEGMVVRDADRLDAIGAIAIARTFLYAGWKGHPIHDPELPPRTEMSKEQYRLGRTTAINHFHEKLLKLKSLLHTDAARAIAEERHRFMESYLEQFHKEWNGEV